MGLDLGMGPGWERHGSLRVANFLLRGLGSISLDAVRLTWVEVAVGESSLACLRSSCFLVLWEDFIVLRLALLFSSIVTVSFEKRGGESEIYSRLRTRDDREA